MDLELQKRILGCAIKRGSIDSIRMAAGRFELRDEQCAAILLAMLKKKINITADTGLGKTAIAVSLINLVVKNDKVLFILKRGTLDSLYDKISKSLRKDLVQSYMTSQQGVIDRLFGNNIIQQSNVIVISSDSLADRTVNDYLFSIRDEIKMTIIDEVHLFSNMVSVESRLMSYIVRKSEYAITLTATPLQRDIDQPINIAYMLDENIFGGKKPLTVINRFKVFENGVCVGYKDLNVLNKILKKVTFNYVRKENNVKCTKYLVTSKDEWKSLRKSEIVKAAKGDLKGRPFEKLVELLNQYKIKEKRGMIYINLNELKQKVLDRLLYLGRSVAIIDGTISNPRERLTTEMEFNSGKYDILITNIETSLDLDCDFVIFYELTLAYKQIIGRACRDFTSKAVNVDFIIAQGTKEEEMFTERVYNKAMLLSQVCDKNVDELINIKKVREYV